MQATARVLTAVLGATLLAGATLPAGAATRSPDRYRHAVALRRGGPARSERVYARHAGQAVLRFSASAAGASWRYSGRESAVVTVTLDGHHATDVVIPSAQPIEREFAVGGVRAGWHTLRLGFSAAASPAEVRSARVAGLRLHSYSRDTATYAVLKNAPVLYGRSSAGGGYQNNHTDTPLVAWHDTLPASTPGHRVLQYSVVWSNEDGGTDTPDLMARWGRTTDIEWIYRVEVDSGGNRVPGTGVYQSPNHGTATFAGRYRDGHPLLQTCTENNNVCDSLSDARMRFAPSTRQSLPTGQPREHIMDTHPWTYRVMAQEMLREGKIEQAPDPGTPAVSDQRDYLYVAVDHIATPGIDTGFVGLAIGVRLRGDPATYVSDHHVATSSVNRDGPAATTVELPRGTEPSDVAEIVAVRVPVVETGATLHVTRMTRGFFLDRGYRPERSFLRWRGSATLTPGSPTAVLWRAGG